MLSPNLVFLPNSLFIEKQRMVYCMSGWVSTVKCPCQNMLKQTFLQLKHDMGSSKIVSCGLFNQWRQWLSTFWLNGWFASSLITGNVMSEFCETSPSFPINNFYIVIKSLKFSPKNSFQKENNYLIRDWGSEIWIFNGLYSLVRLGNSLYDPLCHDTPISRVIKDKVHQIICCEKAKLSFMADFISECQFKDR